MAFPFKFRLGLLVCYYAVLKLTRKNNFASVAISLRSKCRLTGLIHRVAVNVMILCLKIFTTRKLKLQFDNFKINCYSRK